MTAQIQKAAPLLFLKKIYDRCSTENRPKIPDWFCFSILIPLLLNLIFFCHLWLDQRSLVPRLLIWLFFFSGMLLNRVWCFRIFILTLCSFENITLRSGYPNQFLIETGALSIIFADALFSLHKQENTKEQSSGRFLLLPGSIPLIFAISFTCFSFVNYLIMLRQLSPEVYDMTKLIRHTLIKILDWDVSEQNLVHPTSLVYTHLIYLCFTWTLCKKWKLIFTSISETFFLIVCGSVLVYAYAFLELSGVISLYQTAGISGPFQNPNHFSFYSGLISLLCLWLLASGIRHPVIYISTVLSPFFLFLGRGKSSWLSVSIVLMLCACPILFRIISAIRSGDKKYTQGIIKILIACSLLGLMTAFLLNSPVLREKTDVAREMQILGEIFDDARTNGIRKIFYSSGRDQHLLYALASIRDHIWSGYGWGNFFVMSGSGYDLHFTYLTWLYCFGLPGFCAMLLGLWSFLRAAVFSSFRKAQLLKLPEWLLSGILLYIALAHIVDVFLTYRPLLYLISLIFLCIVIRQGRPQFWKKPGMVLFLTILSGIFAGSATIIAPQLRQPLTLNYLKEHSAFGKLGDFAWQSLATYRNLPPQQCWSTLVSTNITRQALPLVVSQIHSPVRSGQLTPIEQHNNLSLQQINQLEAAAIHKVTLNIWPGFWSELCICNNSPQMANLQIRGAYALVPGMISSLQSEDMRLLSFALSAERYTDERDPPVFRQRRGCDHLIRL
ncbi:MAG: hypothetical protein H6618_02755 [Deltaproteobacteria bacterium]|nr:hypothetical protein [Deltaproteobacteria bacterium]